ncbi:MAG: F0F1 ATP synthase subunit B [Actinomycetota bacterium]|nr:F0F1 ATP synthase subunit B [Actinomycetota bacterium]
MPVGAPGDPLAHAVTTASIFLVPNGTFFAELLLFVVVLGVVAKFILPPLRGAMDERARTVRAAMDASDEGHAEAERLAGERRQVLEAARAEARAVVERAGSEAAALHESARAEGLAQHAALLAEARPRIEAERRSVEEALLARMGELAVAAAAGVVGSPVDGDRHQGIIEAVVSRARSAGHGEEER